MKTVRINKLKNNLLIVELPNGWDYELVGDDKTFIYHQTEEGTNDYHIEGHTLLGKPDEIREEDVAELVKNMIEQDFKGENILFMDYSDDTFDSITAKESLLSLIESEIYWENPAKQYWNADHQQYSAKHSEWQKAEKKTFDRNRTLIFIEN